MSLGHPIRAEAAGELVRAVIGGDSARVIEILGPDTVLDVPRLPVAVGASGVEDVLVRAAAVYPFRVEAVDHHHEIRTSDASVIEVRVRLRDGELDIRLPFAVVDSVVSGQRMVRMYHSERLLTGVRKARRPVFPVPPDTAPTLPEDVHPAIGAYLTAIASADPDRVLSRLAPGATMDNGVRPVSARSELRAVFSVMVSSGGVRLVRINEFDDGRAIAFEYTGLPRPMAPGASQRTPPGGGVSIYAYDHDDRIVEVRMFDDFDPDALVAAGSSQSDPDHS